MNVSDFIYSSKSLSKFKDYYVTSEEFLKAYNKFSIVERKSLVLHYIMDNSPFAFTMVYEKPLIFEQVRQYISHILDVDVNNIKLIGSTKTGFSMGYDNYGAPYKKDRDLDLMILDEVLFSKLRIEFGVWQKAYQEDKTLHPRHEREKEFWDDHMKNLPKSFGWGYIDTYKMPNRNEFLPVTSKVNNTMAMVVRNLKSEHGFSTQKASMRVYKDFESYFCQQNRNIEAILKVKGYKGDDTGGKVAIGGRRLMAER